MNLLHNLLTGNTDKASSKRGRLSRAFTLPEVVMSVAISSMAIGGIIYGYIISARRAEWSAYSLAAQQTAIQILERARAAKWDPTLDPPVDLLTKSQFPDEVILMDIPVSGTNAIYSYSHVTISNVSLNPPVRMIRVDCRWVFLNGRYYSNTVVTYRSPKL